MGAERFEEGGDVVGRRGEAPLAVCLQPRPLRVDVEGQRMAVALGGRERVAAGDDEAEADNEETPVNDSPTQP